MNLTFLIKYGMSAKRDRLSNEYYTSVNWRERFYCRYYFVKYSIFHAQALTIELSPLCLPVELDYAELFSLWLYTLFLMVVLQYKTHELGPHLHQRTLS